MAERDPKARALEAQLEASITQLLQGSEPPHGLLMLGTWQEAMPALVHLDPVLEPVDSRVFAVLWLWAKQQGRTALAFPSYDYVMQRSNIHAKGTLSRCLALLRLTRWITLCRRVRDQGRYRGNIYALHDEPLSIETTMVLDSHFLDFIEQSCGHKHPKVSQFAQTLKSELALPVTHACPAPLASINDRLTAITTVSRANRGSYFGLRPVALHALQPKLPTPALPRDPWPPVTEPSHSLSNRQVQKMNSVHVQNLNSVGCSSSGSSLDIYNKTTTTTNAAEEDRSRDTSEQPVPLIFHRSLSQRECGLARSYLQGFDPDMQQALLDELAEKIEVQAKQTCRVRNPLALLSWLCREVKAGRPALTSAHLRHRERRERQQALEARIEADKAQLTAMAKAELKRREPRK